MTHTAPAVEGFAHITLPIHDLEVAERFYVELLGAKLVRKFDRETFLRYRPDRAHEADADNSPQHLAVQFGNAVELHLFLQKGRSRPVPAPHPHLAMGVNPRDLDTCIARLKHANVKIDGPRRLGPPGHASVYFADPFGNVLEFVTMGYRGPVNDGPPDVSVL
ncbi:VOC family protein [Nannocystis radixulma]|uniref:VOC family protein n=1 Tax=Nannocystis radixulma TaxID=2995305 RepID=A0ABT5BAG5_9BACT|nr:VOC family protein [Nannocystis radixulma]MDC0670615.1 VOC family protein [Nannocystis radixulma]